MCFDLQEPQRATPYDPQDMEIEKVAIPSHGGSPFISSMRQDLRRWARRVDHGGKRVIHTSILHDPFGAFRF